MALSVSSSCRFSQPLAQPADTSLPFRQETTLSSHTSDQQVNFTPQGYLSTRQHITTHGALPPGHTDIPQFTSLPVVPVSFPSHMRGRQTNTREMTQLRNRSASGNAAIHSSAHSTGVGACAVKDRNRKKSNRKSKSTYKHVPHREKPAHLVARRNARERRRVQAVNSAFIRLRRHVPHEHKHKRLSKVKTLHIAIEYIHYLRGLIEEYDSRQQQQQQQQQEQLNAGCGHQMEYTHAQMVDLGTRSKENQHWMQNNVAGNCDVRDMYIMEGFSQFH